MALRIPISVCLCEVDVVLEKRGGGLRVYTLPGPAERFKSGLYGGHNVPFGSIRVNVVAKMWFWRISTIPLYSAGPA